MAPSRGKGKGKEAVKGVMVSGKAARLRSTRAKQIPDVYQSMLDEAQHDDFVDSDRPLKRRKAVPKKTREVIEDIQTPSALSVPSAKLGFVEHGAPSSPRPPVSSLQTVEDSSEDEGSDLEFEDVEMGNVSDLPSDTAGDIEDLSITLQPETKTKPSSSTPRRKPATVAEKAQRLLVHKMHLLCLLGHCMYVNGRCNNEVVQRHLRSLLSTKNLSYLNPKSNDTQFQRNRSFLDGLQQVVDIFNAQYRTLSGGLMRPQWNVNGEPGRSYDPVTPMDRADFISAAKELEGTQDTGNQLFCALLRSAGIDARLVCSLQALPFISVPKAPTPRKPMKETIYAMAPDTTSPIATSSTSDDTIKGSVTIGNVPSVRRRLGQPSFASGANPVTSLRKEKKPRSVPKLTYPVFWVEAFNQAQQKWIAVDAIVTHAVNKAGKFEPPSSYDLNQMAYVVAFEEDGVARDVTKRYAKAYNAKTRRHRVEASADGTKWLKKAFRIFRRRGGGLDRDQVEDSELAQKEAREGMPGNVQDFKDHPFYALERHLKRHEVIHPKREVGKVNAGTAAKPRMESVYRRQDVYVCKSADKWYRVGREIKVGEQPLKHVPTRSTQQRSVDKEEGDGPAATTALYAPYQTQQYIPPPVERGKIPKNRYGNLDIYVPSMVPAGGIHIRHHLAQQAARVLRVDYADTVTGFKFQGRHGTAIIEGVVVAEPFGEAVQAVIEGFEDQIEEDESKARSLAALRTWKLFLVALRIKERVNAYEDGSRRVQEQEGVEEIFADDPEITNDEKPLLTAGQFTLKELARPSKAKSTKRKAARNDSDDEYDFPEEAPSYDADEGDDLFGDGEGGDMDIDGGFLPDDAGPPVEPSPTGGFFADDESDEHEPLVELDDGDGGFLPEAEDSDGGFLPEEVEESGGGFVQASTNEVMRTDEPTGGDFGMESYGAAKQQSRPNEAVPPDVLDPQPDDEIVREGGHQQIPLDTQAIPTEGSGSREQASPTIAAGALESDRESDRESDNGSMLSHDPEDDDMEPDWLESD